MKSAKDLVIAVRNQDRTQNEAHDKLGERLQAVQKIEIQMHLRLGMIKVAETTGEMNRQVTRK
jgi:hypothetical protein